MGDLLWYMQYIGSWGVFLGIFFLIVYPLLEILLDVIFPDYDDDDDYDNYGW